MDKPYIVGMDAGGTSTKVVLASLDGTIFDRFEGNGMNVNSFGVEGTRDNLKKILAEIAIRCDGYDQLKGICIGAAGISNADTQRVLKEGISQAGISVEPLLVGDHTIGLYGAEGTGEGIMLIAGTGSICCGRKINENGEVLEGRSGGRGHLIDDEGSAYAIGRDVLSTIVRSLDGREEPTVMWKAVKEQLGVENVNELIRFVYGKDTGKKEIAQLAPIVMKGVDAGEEAAFEILKKAALNLADIAVAVCRQLEITSGKVCISGSVLEKNTLLYTFTNKELKRRLPGMSLDRPKYSAAQGAILACLENLQK